MKLKLNINSNKISLKNTTFVNNKLEELINDFNERYSDGIIEPPEHPLLDSKGRKINQDGFPSYVKIIRRGEDPKFPTFLRSKDNSALNAEIFSLYDYKWKPKSNMWKEYVYEGVPGIDFQYVDDIYLNKFFNKIKNNRR